MKGGEKQGSSKDLRKQRAGYLRQIKIHLAKVAAEKRRLDPNLGRIQHWQKEIDHFTTKVQEIDRKLNRHYKLKRH